MKNLIGYSVKFEKGVATIIDYVPMKGQVDVVWACNGKLKCTNRPFDESGRNIWDVTRLADMIQNGHTKQKISRGKIFYD